MVTKKVCYFILLLFVNVYFFILFDRLSYGLPARFLVSFVFAVLLIGPVALTVIWNSKLIEAGVVVQRWKLFLRMFLVAMIPSFFSGSFFWLIRVQGATIDNWIMISFITPVAGIIFVFLIGIITLFVSFVLVDTFRIAKTVKALMFTAVLLLVLVVLLLVNCSPLGCKNTEAWAERALIQDDPSLCDGRQLKVDIRPNIFSIFEVSKDPRPSEWSKEYCTFIYTQKRSSPVRDIRLCLLVKDAKLGMLNLNKDQETYAKDICIERIMRVYQDPVICEQLIGSTPQYYFDYRANRNYTKDWYSQCYYVLAKTQKREDLCEKIDYPHFKNECYSDLAFYKHDVKICDKIIPNKDEYSYSKESCVKQIQKW